MRGIAVSGVDAPDASGNSFISTTSMGGAGNQTVELTEMSFTEFDVNKGLSVIAAAKGTFYDRIEITGSTFRDVFGTVVKNGGTDFAVQFGLEFTGDWTDPFNDSGWGVELTVPF